MRGDELKRWRQNERARLLAAREALPVSELQALRERIDTCIEGAFPELAQGVLAFCWPIRNEYDARPLAARLRARGARTALPVVRAPRSALAFCEWRPGVTLVKGPLGIPFPVGSPEVVPTSILVPLLGFDAQGYRLGFGAGYFDRTLAALQPRPLTIGVGYEIGRLGTIYPQSWDVPLDWVVTERGVHRRCPAGLALQG